MGALFRNTRHVMLEKTLCERIEQVILKILSDLLEILCIDVEATLHQLMSSEKTTRNVIVILSAVNQLNNNPETHFNTA